MRITTLLMPIQKATEQIGGNACVLNDRAIVALWTNLRALVVERPEGVYVIKVSTELENEVDSVISEDPQGVPHLIVNLLQEFWPKRDRSKKELGPPDVEKIRKIIDKWIRGIEESE